MKKNGKAAKAAFRVLMVLIAAAAITCILLSIATDKATPYLTMGLGLTTIGNAMIFAADLKKRKSNAGSDENGNIS